MLGGFSGVPIHKSGVNVDIALGLIQLGGDGGRVTTLDMGILSLPLSPPLQPYLNHHTIPYQSTPCQTTPYHTIPYHIVPYQSTATLQPPHHTIPIRYHETMPHRTIPYHTIPNYTIPYHTIPYPYLYYQTIPNHIPYKTILPCSPP